MKKLLKGVSVILVCAMIFSMVPAGNINAATKKKETVSYTLKKGVLTIKGKGKMPKNMTFRNNKKIKKVVIKKGVTSISNEAFYKCKNLKTVSIPSTIKTVGIYSFAYTKLKSVTIPNSVTEIGVETFWKCNKLKNIKMPGKIKIMGYGNEEDTYLICGTNVDTVEFTSPLNIETVSYVNANNFIVSKSDPEFTSVDGFIYTKDKTVLVRVPSVRKVVNVIEGCKVFNTSAIQYCTEDGEGDNYGGCYQIEKIIFPKSLEKIDNDRYKSKCSQQFLNSLDIVIQTDKLDGKSLSNLVNIFDDYKYLILNKIMNQLPNQIKEQEEMYITNDGYLISYLGNKKQIIVPDGVKVIGKSAFQYQYDLNKVILPDTVTVIDDYAFYNSHLMLIDLPKNVTQIGEEAFDGTYIETLDISNVKSIGDGAFCYSGIKELKFSEGMTVIPDRVANGCSNLKSIYIPSTVKEIGRMAFADCNKLDLGEFKFGENLATIQEWAFAGVKWSKIIIPANVSKIGEMAFDSWLSYEGKYAKGTHEIVIEGKSKGYHKAAFEGKGVVLKYKAGIKEAKTKMAILRVENKGTHKRVTVRWIKVKDVSGYVVTAATDKKFKKNVKKGTYKASKTSAIIQMKKDKKRVYAKIRPYKIVNGKKVYGKWMICSE